MTARELLVSTVKFYTSENRGYNKKIGECVYGSSEKSPGCAIGRHLTKENAIKLDDCVTTASVDVVISSAELRCYLPDWMLKMDVQFLSKIQVLHDAARNWTLLGISQDGTDNVNKIVTDFNLEPLTEEEFKHDTGQIN
jgi:hypothetical protein